MRFAYATDLHGNRAAFRSLFQAAAREQVDAIVIGGDVCPKKVAVVTADSRIIPLDMLVQGVQPATFQFSLSNIDRLNSSQVAQNLSEYLKDEGYLLVSIGETFADVRDQQALMAKLWRFLRDEQHSSEGEPFTEEEIEATERLVLPLLRKTEAEWSPAYKRIFVDRVTISAYGLGSDFESVRPSKFLLDCLRCHRDPGLIERCADLKVKKRRLDAYAYSKLIDPDAITQMVDYSLAKRIDRLSRDMDVLGARQAEFLTNFLLPAITEWRRRNSGNPVYVLLGNDDVTICEQVLIALEGCGLLCYLNGRIHPLPHGKQIVGYGHVESLPYEVKYTAWLKSAEEIAADLESLRAQASADCVWVVHNPALGIMDESKPGNHLGSLAVKGLVQIHKPRWLLTGHIHEAPQVAGSAVVKYHDTICVNPGGDHSQGLAAVVIDTETGQVDKLEG